MQQHTHHKVRIRAKIAAVIALACVAMGLFVSPASAASGSVTIAGRGTASITVTRQALQSCTQNGCVSNGTLHKITVRICDTAADGRSIRADWTLDVPGAPDPWWNGIQYANGTCGSWYREWKQPAGTRSIRAARICAFSRSSTTDYADGRCTSINY